MCQWTLPGSAGEAYSAPPDPLPGFGEGTPAQGRDANGRKEIDEGKQKEEGMKWKTGKVLYRGTSFLPLPVILRNTFVVMKVCCPCSSNANQPVCVFSHSWRAVLRSSCDVLTGDEIECCCRVVQLCCDSLLAVYVASSDPSKFGAAAASPVTTESARPSSPAAVDEV